MKELLFTLTKDDFEVQTFCSGGPGGQNQNKRSTGVRIIHKASGAVGESREERSQLQNRQRALKRLTETVKFKLWLNKVISEMNLGKTVEELVDEMMNPKHLKVEGVDDNGNWVQIK